MQTSVYLSESEHEAVHWWFEGRRRLFARMLKKEAVPHDAVILDAGSGTGANLKMMTNEGYSNVVGLDQSSEAIKFCAEKRLPPVHQGSLTALPFPAEHFDFILATDVLEHLDDDHLGAAEIARVLKANGHVLITVPAFKSLWGPQDDLSQHKRRYVLDEIVAVLNKSGLSVQKVFYFNYVLFPVIWAGRAILKKLRVSLRSEADINAPILNRLLLWIFNFDTLTAPKIHPPFGVSIFVWATRAAPPT